MNTLLNDIINCGVFNVGNFKLKCGSFSPIYIDLRTIISYPNVVKNLTFAIRDKQIKENVKCDVVCGVPYTALPIATYFSVSNNIKMLMKRKEAKDHGLKRLIEGNITAGESCLIIEDIVSSGTSVIETAEALRHAGLKVEDCIVVVNRNQGGLENLKRLGIKLHSLFDIKDVFQAYCTINNLEVELIEQVNCYFKTNNYLPVMKRPSKKSFSERTKICAHQIGTKLFTIMELKKTNLCVAVDTNSSAELLNLADRLGPFICILKTHIDILKDFSEIMILKLKELSKAHNFLIMEDRKFADIGNTVKQQFLGGQYRIQSWADMVTVHAIPGRGIIDALRDDKCASVLIAEMSSSGALSSDEYKSKVFEIAESNVDCVVGYVAQNNYPKDKFLHMCPGVNISLSGDTLGQQYKTPEEAIDNGADIIIVGRGICNANNIEEMASIYRDRAFNAYLKNMSS